MTTRYYCRPCRRPEPDPPVQMDAFGLGRPVCRICGAPLTLDPVQGELWEPEQTALNLEPQKPNG